MRFSFGKSVLRKNTKNDNINMHPTVLSIPHKDFCFFLAQLWAESGSYPPQLAPCAFNTVGCRLWLSLSFL